MISVKEVKEVKEIVKELLHGKRIDETKNFKTIRIWGRNQYGDRIIILLNFRTFPDNKADFKTYVQDGVAYLSLVANSPRLISSEDLIALHVLFDTSTDPEVLDFTKILAKIADVKSRGPYWDHQLEVRSDEIEQKLLDIFHDIPESTWNDTDRSTLRRPAKSTEHHDADVMEVAPELTIRGFWHKAIKLHFHNPETPETDAMPKYQKIKLEIFIGPANTVLSSIVATKTIIVSRALYTLFFVDANVGQTLFSRATYINSVGIEGEVSSDWVPQPIA
jgi:hypothetical protein